MLATMAIEEEKLMDQQAAFELTKERDRNIKKMQLLQQENKQLKEQIVELNKENKVLKMQIESDEVQELRAKLQQLKDIIGL